MIAAGGYGQSILRQHMAYRHEHGAFEDAQYMGAALVLVANGLYTAWLVYSAWKDRAAITKRSGEQGAKQSARNWPLVGVFALFASGSLGLAVASLVLGLPEKHVGSTISSPADMRPPSLLGIMEITVLLEPSILLNRPHQLVGGATVLESIRDPMRLPAPAVDGAIVDDAASGDDVLITAESLVKIARGMGHDPGDRWRSDAKSHPLVGLRHDTGALAPNARATYRVSFAHANGEAVAYGAIGSGVGLTVMTESGEVLCEGSYEKHWSQWCSWSVQGIAVLVVTNTGKSVTPYMLYVN
jgi:hypothetical protein